MHSALRRGSVRLFGIVVLLPTVAGTAVAQSDKAGGSAESAKDWPQFLGPDRNGISAETGLLTAWPAEGPPEVWRVPGGVGMSGLAIKGARAYTMLHKAGRQQVVCLNARTGELHWEAPIAPVYRNSMGDGPRATPAVAGDQVFVLTGEGIVAALSAMEGNVTWKKDVVTDFGGKPAEYGMVSSPLVIGNRVVVTVGAPQATVVALDTKTGDVAWTGGKGFPAGYSSPAVLEVGGRAQLVVFHGAGVFGLEPTGGKELWSYEYVTDFDCNIVTPIAVGGNVFISSGENHGSTMLALKPQGDRFETAVAWKSQGGQSVLRNEWQTSILLGGNLYGFDNVGSAGPITHFTCVEASTGNRRWQQIRFGKGNAIAADGKLLVSTFTGELVVLAANPERFEELGRKMVVGKTRQAPALANGLLYLRDDREIVCLDVRKK